MLRAFAIAAALLGAVPAVGQADTLAETASVVATSDLGADRFAAGGSLRLETPVAGDLIAAGGLLDVHAPVGNDALVAGGNIRIDRQVGSSLYAAAGRVIVDGNIGRNARIAGGQVDIGRRAEVGGSLTVGGGQINLHGMVRGYVQAVGGNVHIDGRVGGDVFSNSGVLTLGPNARIAGQLRYASREEVRRDPAARVEGGIERIDFPVAVSPPGPPRQWVHAVGWAWSIGLVLIAALMAGTLPVLTDRIGDTVRSRWGMSILVGFIGLVCIPVASLILFLTVIGIPLALATVALYMTLLLVGYVTSGIATGVMLLSRVQPGRMGHPAWQVGAAALGMLALTLLARVPLLGALVFLLALVLGVGVLLMQLRRPAGSTHSSRVTS